MFLVVLNDLFVDFNAFVFLRTNLFGHPKVLALCKHRRYI